MNSDALAVLLTDPARTSVIPRDEVPALLGQLERLRAVLWSRLTTPEVNGATPPCSDIEKASGDRMLTTREAAKRLGVDERWMYRKADSLPFTRRLGNRTLRFSQTGLDKWLATRP